MSDKFVTVEFTLPEFWAPALINGDTSGLEAEEIKQIDAFMAANADAQTFNVTCDAEEEPSFHHNHDASFYGVLACSCRTYQFTQRVSDEEMSDDAETAETGPVQVHIQTFDVWGNAEDGYNVNDTFSYGTFECSSEDDLCGDTVGFLNEHFFKSVVSADKLEIRIEDNGDYLDIEVNEAEDGKPICQLTVER